MNASSTLRIHLLAAFGGLACVIAIYWLGLGGAFFFDDETNILGAPGVRLESLSFEAISQALASGRSGPSGRPVSQISFALNYLISGFDPFAFKLTNLLIHCLNGVLIFFVTAQLIAAAQLKSADRWAGITAGVWLVHPIQLTSVLYVVQRMTSLSAFFLLLALLLHIRVRQRETSGGSGWVALLLAWGVFWPLSIYSKETGILLPGFVAAYELIIRRHARAGLDSIGRAFLFCGVAVSVLATCYLFSPLADWLWAGYEFRSFTLVERLLTEARVFWQYLGLIVAPRLETLGLYHDDIVISTNVWTPWTTFPALLGLGGLMCVAWWMRASSPLASFGIIWFMLGHSLESTFLPLEIAHEHRNYLPLLGVILLPIGVLADTTAKAGIHRRVAIAICCAAIGYLGLVTTLRAHQFGDEGRRTQVETLHHPASARAQYDFGALLARRYEANRSNPILYSLGRKSFERAQGLDLNSKLGLLGMLHFDCLAGTLPDKNLVLELARRLRETPFAPGDRIVLFSLKEMSLGGTLCLSRIDIDALFAAALANPRVSPSVQAILHSWHFDYLWNHEHDITAAREALQQSLALQPSNQSNRLKWAQVMLFTGERQRARQLILELRGESFSGPERETLDELLASVDADAN